MELLTVVLVCAFKLLKSREMIRPKSAKFDLQYARFQHIHVDIVMGPLPLSNGYKYIFNVVDRYTRWPEAVPMYDMTAETCA